MEAGGQDGMAFAMKLGALSYRSAKDGLASETMAKADTRRDDLLRKTWSGTCMQTAHL